MTTTPNNILQAVQTYAEANMAYLQNQCVLVSTANKKFENFNKITANRGDTVTFSIAPRMSVSNNLAPIVFEAAEERKITLTADQARHVAYEFSTEDYTFYGYNDLMTKFGKSAMTELATSVESNVSEVIPEHTYRFYGDGSTAIDSYKQLAEALAVFRNYGAAKEDSKFYLPDLDVPGIIDSGHSQFLLEKNNETINSWELGEFSRCKFYESNLLPIHIAGTLGQAGTTLTVVSTNDPTGANITEITCSGAGTDANAIKLNDLAVFDDGVSGQPDLRYLTFIGHKPSGNLVQIRATADSASSGGNVTFSLSASSNGRGLSATTGRNQNILHNIVAGMQLHFMPSHRCGLITAGNPLYVAMPKLSDTAPYSSMVTTDPESGISMRMYYGWVIEQAKKGNIHDIIWGRTMVDEYAMRVLFPV